MNKTFQEFLIEADTKASLELENLIVHSVGGEQPLTSFPNVEKKVTEDVMVVAEKICKNAGFKFDPPEFGEGDSTKGRMSDSATGLDSDWSGKNKTPKTDFHIGTKNVSLKSGPAALMSGGPDEAESTFKAALEKTEKDFDKETKSIADQVSKDLKNMIPSTQGKFKGGFDAQKYGSTTKSREVAVGFKGDEKFYKVKPGTIDKDTVLKKADESHKNMMESLNDLFDKNDDFKNAFVYEAMTGEKKFSPSKDSIASDFLVAGFNGDATLHTISGPDDPYVKKIAKQITLSIRFKSGSQKVKKVNPKSGKKEDFKTGYYRFWSAVQLNIANINNISEEIDRDWEKMQSLLTEGMITELAFLKWVKKKFKQLKNAVYKLANNVKKFVKKGIKNLLEFLDVKVEIEGYDGEVKW